jgi:hypothetical protein
MYVTKQHIIISMVFKFAAAFLTCHLTGKMVRKLTEQIPFLLACNNTFMRALPFSAAVERKLTFPYEYIN